jgi:NAD(P)-dependent dehydrogenase (short-subunit alcohol dehydrogenase family)
MSIRFDGKIAIVTGGAMGIGAATAGKLCQLGAAVAVLDRDVKSGEATVEGLTKAGYRASFHSCDVSRESSVKEAIDHAVERHGGLHVLVSNAGIQRYGGVVDTQTLKYGMMYLMSM